MPNVRSPEGLQTFFAETLRFIVLIPGENILTRDEHVGIAPDEYALVDETWFESAKKSLASSSLPVRLVIVDRAAALREADFLRVYSHAPLARIVRLVGPWRAGIGRTDPTWPLGTTWSEDRVSDVDSLAEVPWCPPTSGYDELVSWPAGADLTGLSVTVRISDQELREMWADSLEEAGAELGFDGTDILVSDNLESSPAHPAARLIVHLRPDPWNAIPRGIGFQPVRISEEDDRLEAFPTDELPLTITASVLDSPALVLQQIAAALMREPL